MTRPFSAARYARLLEGLEISEALRSYVISTDKTERLDAEFYQKAGLNFDVLLAGVHCKNLKNMTEKIDVGFVGSMASQYSDNVDDTFLLQTQNISEFFINNNEVKRIRQDFHIKLKKSQIHYGDILIARSGSFGKASIYLEHEIINSADIIIVKANDNVINKFYLVCYLNSACGKMQMLRFASGGLQGHVNLTILENLKVPLLDVKIQRKVEQVILSAYTSQKAAINHYREAEQFLLHELGLEGWQPPEPLTYARRASEVFANERLDAEHFQPKFDAAILQMKAQSYLMERLGDLIEPVFNGWDCRDFREDGIPYIRVADIRDGRIKFETAARVPISMADITKDISLRVGDVLFTRKGSFGNAAHVREGEEHVIISSEIMLIRLKPEWKERLQPEFLSLYFNSVAGALQSEQWAHGVAFYSITQADLLRFQIPILPLSTQTQIKFHLEQAHHARQEAQTLLAKAKRAVEVAIEEGEAAALAYLAND